MNKFTGQQLKKDLESTKRKLDNLEFKINKKFNMYLDHYREYFSEEHTNFLIKVSSSDISIEFKLGVIIQTEANYVKATGNQGEIFN